MSAAPRVVMLTGAAGNLGRAVAQAFAAQGDSLVLIDLDHKVLSRAYGDETEQRRFAPADLRAQTEIDAAVKTALTRFGRIDVLCNLAGGFRMG
ncbi:MAG: SDR family NAD(P)-dependent oxidoreductase, partial [Rhizobacter sp.]|nr:SDR family NAD(P)-dependent oxidoreductase [Rhizobacter sp.]